MSATVKRLTEKFPNIEGISAESGWGHGVLFLGNVAEGGTIDEIPAADYYAEDPHEKVYVFGVHKDLIAELEHLGYHPEWYDPGTLLAYKD